MKLRRWAQLRPSRVALAWVAALTAAGALVVWLHLQTTEVGYQLIALHKLVERLGSEKAELEVELATLTSPRSLDAVAKSRLGLRPPREGQVVGLP
ncbi:MAG: cell division protein FtsL [Deltaproteobacteria bacterium]|nr:cell division protein FtsL [Deltaproteobacteria bacterium]